jgi:hypothetical protein
MTGNWAGALGPEPVRGKLDCCGRPFTCSDGSHDGW